MIKKSLKKNISKLLIDLNLDSDCVLINCISLSNVDKCETNKEDCKFQNSLFVNYLYSNLKKPQF